MINKIIKKINHVIDRLYLKIVYVIANTILKNKVDSENNYFNIMDDKELIDLILNKNKSYTRFGDGELSLILNPKFDLSFQKNSEELSILLSTVLNSNLDNLIIGINRSFNDPKEYNEKVIKSCRAFNCLYRNSFKKIIPNNRIYGNSSITRFYIDYDTNDKQASIDRFKNIKRIWDDKKLLIVEGAQSKLGVGNDMFEGVKGIRRILVPSINAFDKYKEIVNKIKENVQQDELVLVAAGPTATIIVYELAKLNIQAVDIGHIDIEYEWMKLGVSKRVAIKGKYVNEIHGKKYVDGLNENEDYETSIIAIIK